MACAAVIVLGFGLTGCSALGSLTQCARGVGHLDDAAKGLIDAARTAKTPSDICQWITPTMTVSQSQLETLKGSFGTEPDSALTFTVGDQLGSSGTVLVSSADGVVSESLDGIADSHGNWTIAYGTPVADGDATGPSSAPTRSPTP